MIFEKIPDSVIIVSKNGKLFQHIAYIRKNEIFYKDGSGYVGLRHNGTSLPRVNLVDYDIGTAHKFAFTKLGRLVTKRHANAYYRSEGNYDQDKGELTKIGSRRKKAS